jgi:hypothetical protein
MPGSISTGVASRAGATTDDCTGSADRGAGMAGRAGTTGVRGAGSCGTGIGGEDVAASGGAPSALLRVSHRPGRRPREFSPVRSASKGCGRPKRRSEATLGLYALPGYSVERPYSLILL